jgi:catechol 2,3-dioxygenase-like lactoylglutathione lyase family enzyme
MFHPHPRRSIASAASLLALVLLSLSWSAALAGDPLATAVGPIGITVGDLDRSVAFYRDVLSFEPVGEPVEVSGGDWEHLLGVFGLRARIQRLRLGAEEIELIAYLAPRGRPGPADSRSNDRWFQHIAIITSDMDGAYRHLRSHGVAHASSGPQRLPDWNPGAAGIEAFYFKDPDSNMLEILAFPPGKGEARWQAADRLFLGIDHTAIVVADTGASLELYRDTLGLKVAGEGENWGAEQEHLNNVFGARLRITALRASSGGPAIELLEYLAPRDGRPTPIDTRANDLWHWQTHLVTVSEGKALEDALRGQWWVSPGWVEVEGAEAGFGAAMMLRDPDGHGLLLTAEDRR